jgi:3-hydroxyisobutyrate dehydrogenase
MSNVRVALLGLGTMGSGMAKRILEAGFALTVYNRRAERGAALESAGARLAGTAREAAEGAEVVISILADDEACRNIWLGEAGALAGAAEGAVLVESSTVTLGWIRELAAGAKKKGCELLDAPVTGSKMQAANGELNFLVGGEGQALEKARPVLEAMSKNALHLGGTGSGTLMKLINNFMCGVQLASLAEAMGMIERSGLNREKALEILANGTPGSPFVKVLSPRMTARNYEPNFMLKLMAKDLRYARAEGEAMGVDLKTASAALREIQEAIGAGWGEKDLSSLVEIFRESK